MLAASKGGGDKLYCHCNRRDQERRGAWRHASRARSAFAIGRVSTETNPTFRFSITIPLSKTGVHYSIPIRSRFHAYFSAIGRFSDPTTLFVDFDPADSKARCSPAALGWDARAGRPHPRAGVLHGNRRVYVVPVPGFLHGSSFFSSFSSSARDAPSAVRMVRDP